MHFSSLLTAAGLPLFALGAVRRATTDTTFQLYAYGEGLGGLPIFYQNGFAYAGDSKLANSSDAAPVIFSATDDTFLGSPNTTDTNNTPTWSNMTLFVPRENASDTRVGFQSQNSSSDSTHITSGFVLYGSTAALTDSNGLQTLWAGKKSNDTGLYSLHWNDTSDGMVPLTLRRIAPSSPVEL